MSHSFSPSVLLLPFDRHGVTDESSADKQSSIPMYTPRWYALRVLDTTAHDWWTDGVPPVRGRRQRARQAVAGIAAGVVRRMQPQLGRADEKAESDIPQASAKRRRLPG